MLNVINAVCHRRDTFEKSARLNGRDPRFSATEQNISLKIIRGLLISLSISRLKQCVVCMHFVRFVVL